MLRACSGSWRLRNRLSGRSVAGWFGGASGEADLDSPGTGIERARSEDLHQHRRVGGERPAQRCSSVAAPGDPSSPVQDHPGPLLAPELASFRVRICGALLAAPGRGWPYCGPAASAGDVRAALLRILSLYFRWAGQTAAVMATPSAQAPPAQAHGELGCHHSASGGKKIVANI